jgi:signal transduction histidine kinase
VLAGKINVLRQNIVFRLSLGYALVLLLLFTISFISFSFLAKAGLEKKAKRGVLVYIDECTSIFQSEGLEGLRKDFLLETHASGAGNVSLSVLNSKGLILITSDSPQWQNFAVQSDMLNLAVDRDKPVMGIVTVPGFDNKVIVAYARLSPDKILRIAHLLRRNEIFLYNLRKTLIVIMAITLVTVIIAGWLMLRQVIGRVVVVTNTALSIKSSSLSKRVPVSGLMDEIDHLAQAFNNMLDKIESLVKSQQEITDNVAHDLRIPLTRIRLIAESILTTRGEKTDSQESVSMIIEESDRLLEMINTMLEIKSIEMGIAVWDLTDVDIAEVVKQACEFFQLAAEDKGLTLNLNQGISFVVKADLRCLQRVFSSLIDNAVKYTPPGGNIEITMRAINHEIAVEISDTGIGIAPDALPRIFERFYRGDKSRNVSGLGLGLSLAETIIKAHDGRIKVESTVGNGSTFIVFLPGCRPVDNMTKEEELRNESPDS